METDRLADLRPRALWDLVDDAFDLYRERFLPLAALCAALLIPALLGDAVLTTRALTRMQAAIRQDPSNPLTGIFAYIAAELIGAPLLLVGETLLTAGAAVAVCAQWNGRSLTARQIATTVAPSAPALLIAAIGICLIWLLAACPSLGLGAFAASALTATVAPCLVLERRGIVAAFRRSFALTAGCFGRALGMTVLLWGLSLLLSVGVAGVVSVAFAALPAPWAGAGDTREVHEQVVSKAVSAIGQVLLAPLHAVASVLLYFDLRVRREGLDIEIAAARSAIALAPDYFGGIAGGAPLPEGAIPPEASP